jgi:hypothetical protein
MIIETKLDREDDAWFMKDNKAVSEKVEEINICVYGQFGSFDEIKTTYALHSGRLISSNEAFATKQDLLDSL